MSTSKTPSVPGTLLQRWGFLIIPCALMLALLWLPFGFSITGIIEEWDVLALFTLHEPFVWVSPDGPLAMHRLRPLTVAPHAIGFLLDPNSFFYWNVLLIVSLLLKGLSGSLIGWWLTGSRRWAVVLALLVVFYPADTMQLSFRSFHINWSISFSLLSVALCCLAYTGEKRWHSACLMLAAVPLAVVATFSYEASLTFVVAPLLLLYARFGWRESFALLLRRHVVTAAWISGVIINIGYVLYVKGTADSYQASLISSPASIDVLDRLTRVISIGFGRALVGGWLDAAAMTWFEFRTYFYLVLSVAMVGYALWRTTRSLHGEDGIANIVAPSTSLVRVAVVGLILVGLGYLPFAASPPHMAISQRTFLGAAFGAALFTTTILIAFSRRSWGLGTALTASLLTIAFAAQMYQFDHYRRLSGAQRTILGDIVQNVPPPPADKTLVIIDKRDQINDVWMVREGMVMALSYLYDRPIKRPVICSPTGGVWQEPNLERRLGTCEETEDGWTLTEAPLVTAPEKGRPRRSVSRSDAVVVTLEANGTTSSTAEPQALLDYQRVLESGHSNLAERYRQILRRGTWPIAFEQFRNLQGSDRYRWDFARWWSLEDPTRGSGWMVGGWGTEHKRQVWRSTAWKILPEATLQFELMPGKGPYVLTARVPLMAPPTTPESIKLRVNDYPVAVAWRDTHTLTAAVPAEMLRNGVNVLTFESPLNREPTPLGFQLDWISLDPAEPPFR